MENISEQPKIPTKKVLKQASQATIALLCGLRNNDKVLDKNSLTHLLGMISKSLPQDVLVQIIEGSAEESKILDTFFTGLQRELNAIYPVSSHDNPN